MPPMAETQSEGHQVIGLTGSFGSGCSYVADHILAGMGYERLPLTKILREKYEEAHPNKEPQRLELQEFGDELRRKHGGDYLARCLYEQKFENGDETNQSGKWVVDSIRNPEEIYFLRKQFQNFFLFGAYAGKERRWGRVENKYNRNRKSFDEDDDRDTGRESESCGQRVEDCFAEADIVFSNDEDFAEIGSEPFGKLKGKIERYVKLITDPLSRQQPSKNETLMAAAYTISQLSSCMKRKVGAVIVDDVDNIISSGFNEVPGAESPCKKEYNKCSRDRDREQFQQKVQDEFPKATDHKKIFALTQENFRMLDHCRALHAEENAIVNLARNGRSIPLNQCTLYSTTYPCRQCANKIATLNLKEVIYLEPYPDLAGKIILQASKVKETCFEGITYKAYSRIYGERK